MEPLMRWLWVTIVHKPLFLIWIILKRTYCFSYCMDLCKIDSAQPRMLSTINFPGIHKLCCFYETWIAKISPQFFFGNFIKYFSKWREIIDPKIIVRTPKMYQLYFFRTCTKSWIIFLKDLSSKSFSRKNLDGMVFIKKVQLEMDLDPSGSVHTVD